MIGFNFKDTESFASKKFFLDSSVRTEKEVETVPWNQLASHWVDQFFQCVAGQQRSGKLSTYQVKVLLLQKHNTVLAQLGIGHSHQEAESTRKF